VVLKQGDEPALFLAVLLVQRKTCRSRLRECVGKEEDSSGCLQACDNGSLISLTRFGVDARGVQAAMPEEIGHITDRHSL
jgi:hypothetical protein